MGKAMTDMIEREVPCSRCHGERWIITNAVTGGSLPCPRCHHLGPHPEPHENELLGCRPMNPEEREAIRELRLQSYREGYTEGQKHPVVRINEDGQPSNLPSQGDLTGLQP